MSTQGGKTETLNFITERNKRDFLLVFLEFVYIITIKHTQ